MAENAKEVSIYIYIINKWVVSVKLSASYNLKFDVWISMLTSFNCKFLYF